MIQSSPFGYVACGLGVLISLTWLMSGVRSVSGSKTALLNVITAIAFNNKEANN